MYIQIYLIMLTVFYYWVLFVWFLIKHLAYLSFQVEGVVFISFSKGEVLMCFVSFICCCCWDMILSPIMLLWMQFIIKHTTTTIIHKLSLHFLSFTLTLFNKQLHLQLLLCFYLVQTSHSSYILKFVKILII